MTANYLYNFYLVSTWIGFCKNHWYGMSDLSPSSLHNREKPTVLYSFISGRSQRRQLFHVLSNCVFYIVVLISLIVLSNLVLGYFDYSNICSLWFKVDSCYLDSCPSIGLFFSQKIIRFLRRLSLGTTALNFTPLRLAPSGRSSYY